MAWINSTVEVRRPQARKAKKTSGAKESVSRLEFYGNDSLICSMPNIDGLEDVARYWSALGKHESTGYGIVPLRWSELQSFAQLHNLPLWQTDLIHLMSRVFVYVYHETKGKKVEPPYLVDGYTFPQLAAMAGAQKSMKNQSPM